MSDITLIHGDCLERMGDIPNGSVYIVSDPPYGMDYKRGARSNNTLGKIDAKSISSTGKRFHSTVLGDDKDFDPSPFLRFPCAFTGAQHFYDRLPKGGSLHCWNKRGDYKPLDQADADMIWVSKKMPSRIFGLVWRGICRHSENNQKILHPTQKPVALMEWMLDLLGVPEGATVLDPYMGAGSTGEACINTKRNFIGIERDEGYFAIAQKRLDGAQSRARQLEMAI